MRMARSSAARDPGQRETGGRRCGWLAAVMAMRARHALTIGAPFVHEEKARGRTCEREIQPHFDDVPAILGERRHPGRVKAALERSGLRDVGRGAAALGRSSLRAARHGAAVSLVTHVGDDGVVLDRLERGAALQLGVARVWRQSTQRLVGGTRALRPAGVPVRHGEEDEGRGHTALGVLVCEVHAHRVQHAPARRARARDTARAGAGGRAEGREHAPGVTREPEGRGWRWSEVGGDGVGRERGGVGVASLLGQRRSACLPRTRAPALGTRARLKSRPSEAARAAAADRAAASACSKGPRSARRKPATHSRSGAAAAAR